MTLLLHVNVSIVESSEPMSTSVCRQSPLAEPNWVVEACCSFRLVLVSVAVPLSGVLSLTIKSVIVVVVNCDFVIVVFGEQVVPCVGVVVPRIVKYEYRLGSVPLHQFPRRSVELFQEPSFSVWFHRLVNWLKCVEC